MNELENAILKAARKAAKRLGITNGGLREACYRIHNGGNQGNAASDDKYLLSAQERPEQSND